jgi:hypothetical protein
MTDAAKSGDPKTDPKTTATPPDLKAAADAKKTEAEATKIIAEAEETRAKARAANTEADLAARKAIFGAVSASTFAGGEVTLNAGAGNAESTLLAAVATADAAQQIIAAVTSKLPKATPKPVIIVAGQQKLPLVHFYAFAAQREVVKLAFKSADALKACADALAKSAAEVLRGDIADLIPDLHSKMPDTAVARVTGGDITITKERGGAAVAGTLAAAMGGPVAVAAAGAGAVVEFAAKIASYFQADYKVGAATVTGVDDDLLAAAVAGGLEHCRFPGRWMSFNVTDVFKLLGELEKTRDTAMVHLADAKRLAAKAAKSHPEVAQAYTDAVNAYMKALSAFDTLVAGLATPDTDNIPAALKIAEANALNELVKDGRAYLLFIRVNGVLGANYSKKSIWNRPWRMPLYVMGGIVANYVLVDCADSEVVCAGETARHGGYLSVNNVAGAVATWRAKRTGARSFWGRLLGRR